MQDAGACPASAAATACSPEGAACQGPTGCVACGPGLWDVETPSCVCSGGKWSCPEPGACIAGPGTYSDSKCTLPSVTDAGPGDAAACEGGPPPDGSTACGGFSPGACGGTCPEPGLQCSYPQTSLTGTCCAGTWSCAGI